MNNFPYRLLAVTLFLMVFLGSTPTSFAGEARIHGFFVQPSLGYASTHGDLPEKFSNQAEYDNWVQSMADAGVEMLFYQWTVHYEKDQTWFSNVYGGSPDADFAFYNPVIAPLNGIEARGWVTPTTWPGSPKQGGKEPVAFLLDAAQKAGVKVWLGLYLNENAHSYSWWQAVTDADFSEADKAAIEHHAQRSIAVVNDLAAQYGSHPAFGGFYYSIEIANNAFIPAANHPYLASIIDRVAKAVHQAMPGKKLALCPFFNTALASPQEFGAMWEYALSNSELDILILQDGVGVEPNTLTATNDQVTPYFMAVSKAAAKAGKPLWGNVELFTNFGSRENEEFVPSTMEKIRLQLTTAAPYVEKFVCFEFHYMDPHPVYTFAPPLGASEANDSAMRKALYESYMAYWQQLQQRGRSVLPTVFEMLLD